MGSRMKPQGFGMFSTFLKAQEGSPTLVLAHAGIEDEGAMEVAKYLAFNSHLLRLDLTGNSISSTGAGHLAEALRQNLCLESLVLRHNCLGEGGETGLPALLSAVADSRVLRHLDLRHNNLQGTLAAAALGAMLQRNASLTHLELSWNPLNPAGGQVLLDYIQQNTTLFDCQLTACGICAETLEAIARLLHRNRKAHGGDMQAGPYKLVLEGAAVAAGASSPRAVTAGSGSTPRGLGATGPPAAPPQEGPSGMVVCAAQTLELCERLVHWRRGKLERDGPVEAMAHVQELLEHLSRSQALLDEEAERGAQLRTHVEFLLRGFQDRALRYQSDIEAAQAKLLEYHREHMELRAIQSRAAEELKLQREAAAMAEERLVSDRRRHEAEESMAKNDLAVVVEQRKAVEQRLAMLQEMLDKTEEEGRRLRSRTDRLRSGLVLLNTT